MPTRCNRGFYCRSYCLLNMFWAPLCPLSGAQEYYTVVAACGILCSGFQVAGLVWSWGLCVRFAGCCSPWKYGTWAHITFVPYSPNMLKNIWHILFPTLNTVLNSLIHFLDTILMSRSYKTPVQMPYFGPWFVYHFYYKILSMVVLPFQTLTETVIRPYC